MIIIIFNLREYNFSTRGCTDAAVCTLWEEITAERGTVLRLP